MKSNKSLLILLPVLIVLAGAYFYEDLQNQFPETKTITNEGKFVPTSEGQVRVNSRNEAHVPPPRIMSAPDYSDLLTAAKLIKQAAEPDEMKEFLKANKTSSIRVERIKSNFWQLKSKTNEYRLAAAESDTKREKLINGEVADEDVSEIKVVDSQYGRGRPVTYETQRMLSDIGGDSRSASSSESSVEIYVTGINSNLRTVDLSVKGREFRRVSEGQYFANYKLKSVDWGSKCVSILNDSTELNRCFN